MKTLCTRQLEVSHMLTVRWGYFESTVRQLLLHVKTKSGLPIARP